MSADLQLTAPVNGELEKEVAARLKVMRNGVDGMVRAGKLMQAWRFVVGCQAERLAEIVPHKELEATLEAKFPDFSRSALYRCRDFAIEVRKRIDPKSPTVGLLTAPKIGKNLAKKHVEELQPLIAEATDGRGLVEFLEDCKLLKKAGEPGGYKPDVERLAKWMTLQEPPIDPTIRWEDLKPGQQLAFKKWDAATSGPRKTAEQLDAEAAELAEDLHKALTEAVNGKWILRVDIKTRQSLEMTAGLVLERLQKLNKASK